jgi:rod shape-determining protein MreC
MIGYKRLFVLLLIFIFLIFFLFPELQKRPMYYMMRPFAYLISTLQNGFMGVVQGVGGAWSGYIQLTQVRKDNLGLNEELERLRDENVRLLEAKAALDRLELLLAFRTQSPYPVIAARVIGRDPTNWYRTLMIDKGERQGVRVDLGVIVPSGAVGRVIKTTPDYAMVLLLTDRNSAVAAIVQETRDEGIVEGTEKGLARIKYLSTLSEVKEGDQVVTSGLTGDFPKGILIGRIRQVERQEMALFHQAEVMPSVDFSKLEEVLVLLPTASKSPERNLGPQ